MEGALRNAVADIPKTENPCCRLESLSLLIFGNVNKYEYQNGCFQLLKHEKYLLGNHEYCLGKVEFTDSSVNYFHRSSEWVQRVLYCFFTLLTFTDLFHVQNLHKRVGIIVLHLFAEHYWEKLTTFYHACNLSTGIHAEDFDKEANTTCCAAKVKNGLWGKSIIWCL